MENLLFTGPLKQGISLERMCAELRAIGQTTTTFSTTLDGKQRTVFIPRDAFEAASSGTPAICYVFEPQGTVSIYEVQASSQYET